MSRIAVVGLGKLGGPLAAVLSSKGHKVMGMDLSAETVKKINSRITPVEETDFPALLRAHPFPATTSYDEAVSASDTAFIIVPTPSKEEGQFSNEYVLQAMRGLGEALQWRKRYYNVVICSTVMPGSCAGEIQAELERASGRQVGQTLGLCYSPEFIAIGSVIHDIQHPDIVLVGQSDQKCGEKLARIMRTLSDAPIKKMSLVNAEISKISLNAYVTMKISFSNVLAEICETIPDADAHVVVNAIGTDRRVGRAYLTPGVAYGGPCFPRDTAAFAHFALVNGGSSILADATFSVNQRQVDRVMRLVKGCATGNTIAVLGRSYKPHTGLTEESFSVALIERLRSESYRVETHDPQAPEDQNGISSSGLIAGRASVVIIATPWPVYAKLVPKVLEDNPGLVILDLWSITPRGPWDETQVLRGGVG